ncbi:TraG family conjugative transposon ATPase [Niabella terrae]
MNSKLENIFPILDIEHDMMLNSRGDISIVFKAELPEIFTLSETDYEHLHQALVRAIKMLPEQTMFHKQDHFYTDHYVPDWQSGQQGFLTRSSNLYFNERPFLSHECYFILTRISGKFRGSGFWQNAFFQRSIVPRQTLELSVRLAFEDAVGQFANILTDAGLELSRLRSTDLYSSRSGSGLIERYYHLLHDGSQRTVCDLELKDQLKIGRKYGQLYTLSDLPDLPAYCGSRVNYDKYSTDRTKFSIGFASSLGLLLPCDHIYNQFIQICDKTALIKKLESRKLRMQSLAAYGPQNAFGRDAIAAFLGECASEQRTPVRAHFNVFVWSEDPEELKELNKKVAAAMAQMDAATKIETLSAPQIWWAGIPGNAGTLPESETFVSFAEQACCFLCLETNYRGAIGKYGIRLGDRITGRPVQVDLSDEPMERGICTNRNKFILGPSGSGKSFFTNHMLRSYHEQGSHIVLVDVGHSYKGLCKLVGGYYFTYSEDDPIRFNPFYLKEGEALDTEKKESIKTLLLALWKKDDENYRRSEYVALSNALQGYFDKLMHTRSEAGSHADIFPCFNTFYEYLQTDFIASLKAQHVSEKHFDIDNFLFVLRPFYSGGEYDYLLNATEHLDLLEQRFIVFELDNIKDHSILFPVVTLIIMEVFISKMRKLKGERKIILIEEAWKALMREGFAEYIKYLFKTVRKFFGEAIVVTQDIEDIISSPIVKQAIVNNSDCKILLDQSKYQNKFDQIQDLLGLTDKEKALVLSVNKANDPHRKYKEVFISLGGTLSKVYRTEVSPEEYLAYTTEESEKIKVEAYASRHGGIEEGIRRLAKEIQ